MAGFDNERISASRFQAWWGAEDFNILKSSPLKYEPVVVHNSVSVPFEKLKIHYDEKEQKHRMILFHNYVQYMLSPRGTKFSLHNRSDVLAAFNESVIEHRSVTNNTNFNFMLRDFTPHSPENFFNSYGDFLEKVESPDIPSNTLVFTISTFVRTIHIRVPRDRHVLTAVHNSLKQFYPKMSIASWDSGSKTKPIHWTNYQLPHLNSQASYFNLWISDDEKYGGVWNLNFNKYRTRASSDGVFRNLLTGESFTVSKRRLRTYQTKDNSFYKLIEKEF